MIDNLVRSLVIGYSQSAISSQSVSQSNKPCNKMHKWISSHYVVSFMCLIFKWIIKCWIISN